jgi:hypothetical protein
MWSPTKLDFLFYNFSLIFERFNENKKKRKWQNRRPCSKTTVQNWF